ncbi:MAG: polysaccharide biosynthesis/export family protein [Prevotellaceae bacterium]|jgi:polysaccharide export outer membrane protein|nr:polysaccharide biosynthesis/export family protein [Prevotellaceae bacterium]
MKVKHIISNEFRLIFYLFLLSGFISCGSTKTIAYLQDAENFKYNSELDSLYDARIKPKDLLTITVTTFDKEASLPFNLTMPLAATQTNSLTSQPVLQSYLVDNEGNIDFPVLGKIQVMGKTKTQLEDLLKQELKTYLKEEPLVNVRFVNYKISVLGEVGRPNTFTVVNEKVNILEALALAGDLTIFGKRENVKLIREHADGGKEIIIINLNDSELIRSPYFYLQQNDILYVEPNKAKARNSQVSTTTSLWISATGVLVSLATFIVTLAR